MIYSEKVSRVGGRFGAGYRLFIFVYYLKARDTSEGMAHVKRRDYSFRTDHAFEM